MSEDRKVLNIDREVDQGGLAVAIKRVGFCLDQLEKYGLQKKIGWSTEIAHHLTVEEVIGALVAAEQELKEEPKEDE